MAAVNPFYLLNLPKNALRCVITQTFIHRIFGISLISKKAKKLIEAVGLFDANQNDNVLVHVNAYIEVVVIFSGGNRFFIRFYAPENALTGEIYEPTEFVVFWAHMPGQLRWTNSRNLTIKDVIDRVKSIFHRKYVTLIFAPNLVQYDPSLIRGVVENIDLVQLPSGNDEYNQRILNDLMPVGLSLVQASLQNNRIPVNILVRNHTKLKVTDPVLQFTLNIMLLVNSKYLDIESVNWTDKVLNRFLKLWMAGSSPSLEKFIIEFPQGAIISKEIVYSGLGCQDVPEQEFCKLSYKEIRFTVPAGKNIRRADGIRATIFFSSDNNITTFLMVVWHYCCVAQPRYSQLL